MINVFPFAGFPIAVYGLGRSGLSAAKALVRSDAEVWAWDDNEAAREVAAEEDIPLVNLNKIDWQELTSMVWSPGIPHTHPKPHTLAVAAKKANVELISDIELLARAQRDAAYVGITGTNGKSTTTALIGHIMEVSGQDVEVGGNLGIPALELAPLGTEGTYVLEMSSYQLELTFSITFDVAVLLNISADHLDRHGGMDGYIKAKKSIFHRQTKPRTAVIGIDDEQSQAIYEELKAADEQNVIPISGSRPAIGGVYAMGGWLYDDTEGQNLQVVHLASIPSLRGDHNGQNAAAAYAVTKAAGVTPSVIAACIQSFGGLAHRQEIVAMKDGVLYVNDSKATNADAAGRALGAFDNIFWIAGGQPKDDGLSGLEAFYPKIKKAFLIGEAAEAFAGTLNGSVDTEISDTIDQAIQSAREAALASGLDMPVVLLSPACASWDQFKSFEDRGDAFKDIVEGLPGEDEDPFEAAGVPEDMRPEGED